MQSSKEDTKQLREDFFKEIGQLGNKLSNKMDQYFMHTNSRIDFVYSLSGLSDIGKSMGGYTLYERNSPTTLKKGGEKLLKDTGFYEIFENEKAKWVNSIKEKKPGNPWMVEKAAFTVIQDDLKDGEGWRSDIHDHFYNDSFKADDWIICAGLVLRDYYLKENPFLK